MPRCAGPAAELIPGPRVTMQEPKVGQGHNQYSDTLDLHECKLTVKLHHGYGERERERGHGRKRETREKAV